MKKTLLFFTCFLTSIFYCHAQGLYSTAFDGGDNGGGTINKLIPATNDLSVTTSFEDFAANPYYTNLIQASNGKLYGMTSNGGKNNDGIIFSFEPTSGDYLKLKDFDNSNCAGTSPTGSLMQAKDGLLYGMTSFGGTYNVGVIFSFNPVSNAYVKLFDFDNSNGANPQGNLIQGSDGKLYGVANGGNNGYGVIFSFDPPSSSFNKLYEYDYTNGAFPEGSLLQASDGKLYGMANNGGSNSVGVIFSFDLPTSTYEKLKDFDTSGGYPYGNLIQAKDGNLYGITFGGGGGYGFIFSFNPVSSNYVILQHFDSSIGGNAYGSLIESDGKLYGMTSNGGSSNGGVIFSYDPSALQYSKLKDLDNTTGNGPYGSLVKINDGNLYGLTFQGGISNEGVIFSLNESTNAYTKLKDFAANLTGRNCSAMLLRATDNKLYGMTSFGGKTNDGVIFSFDPSTAIYTRLKDMDSATGANPYGSLIQAANGKLYGMTSDGGNNNYGVIFSFDPLTLEYNKLIDFNYTNGATPYGSLIQASDGKLYGMTYTGGQQGFGVIFSYDPITGMYNKTDLDDTNGANPYGSLVQAKDGKLYGITFSGGNGYIEHGYITGAGVIFSFDISTSFYTKLKDFNYYDDGGFGLGNLMQASDGKLYGMNSRGGTADAGVIFSYDPSAGVYTKLNDFDIDNGANPFGNIMQAGNGKFYGITNGGGSNGSGVIFSYDVSGVSYTKLVDYDANNGAYPYYGSGFIEVPESAVLSLKILTFSGKNIVNANELLWKVSNEDQLNYYEVQRSDDAQHFISISRIPSAGKKYYTYYDNINAAMPSVYYYRLKTIDHDGNIGFTNTIKLSSGNDRNFVVVNPNPFMENLVVTIQSVGQYNTLFILTDVNGKQLYKANKSLSAGTNVVGIDETNNLSNGTYLLSIITSRQSQTIKVVKGN